MIHETFEIADDPGSALDEVAALAHQESPIRAHQISGGPTSATAG